MDLRLAQDLVVLVPLAGDEDKIARPRDLDRFLECFLTINNRKEPFFRKRYFPQIREDLIDDRLGVFGPGVVRAYYHHISGAPRLTPHDRPFCPVAVAATPEDGNQASPLLDGKLLQTRGDACHGVRGMRVIDKDLQASVV